MIEIGQDVPPPLYVVSSMLRLTKIALFIILWLGITQLIGLTTYYVGENDSLEVKISQALSCQTDSEVKVLIQRNTIWAGYLPGIGDRVFEIDFSTSLVNTFTLEGDASFDPQIIMNPTQDWLNLDTAIKVTGNYNIDKNLIVKNLSFRYAGTYLGYYAIKAIKGMNSITLNNCNFNRYQYCFKCSSDQYREYPVKRIIVDSCQFTQPEDFNCPLIPYDISYHSTYQYPEPIYVSVINNTFTGRVSPGSIDTGNNTAFVSIIGNDFHCYTQSSVDNERGLLLSGCSGAANLDFRANRILNSTISVKGFHGSISQNKFAKEIGMPTLHNLLIISPQDTSTGIHHFEIKGNEFYGCDSFAIYAYPIFDAIDTLSVSIENNSFFGNGGVLQLQTISSYLNGPQMAPAFTNNLVNCAGKTIDGHNYFVDILAFNGLTPIHNPALEDSITMKNCYFHIEDFSMVSGYYELIDCIVGGDTGIDIDPMNFNYELTWNNNVRIPLIMAGYGNEGLGTPYHANRLDIGAVQYSENPHEYVTYTFPPYSERYGLKWMSFPTLDRIWNPAINEPDVAGVFFSPILNNMILYDITWKVQDAQEQSIYFSPNGWSGNLPHHLIPQQGYKIQMAQGLQIPQNISVPGIIPQVAQYPLTIKAHLLSQQTGIDNENWLGYYNSNTSNVFDAFTGIIDNLWFIQTQNWTLVRDKPMPGRPWIYALLQGKEPTLSYGDMVIVKCFNDNQFFWNTAATDQLPVIKELPKHYDYQEKPDYVPIYVELDIHNLPKEIALYVDDVCKGAAVVSDSLVEIPAYILDGVDPNAFIELRCIYDDKAAVDQIPAYRVWNPENNTYENKALTLNRKNYYYMLKLEQNGEHSPALPETSMNVYPNPFNPSTTIRFSMNEPADIKLEIYNHKGQLVKSLAQGNVDTGWQSKVWNGTDNQNRKVASGLYYSKLSYNGKSIVKKMVLLK